MHLYGTNVTHSTCVSSTPGSGGGISVRGGEVHIFQGMIAHNIVKQGPDEGLRFLRRGGGIFLADGDGEVRLNEVWIYNNTAPVGGGIGADVCIPSCTMFVNKSAVEGNTAYFGVSNCDASYPRQSYKTACIN